MTKLISALIIAAVSFIGWQVFKRWEAAKHEEEKLLAKEVVALRGEQLAGMPQQLESSLAQAQQKGLDVFRQWLKTYGNSIQDPRKAWIELDYCLAISRDDPAEARRIFADVKARTGPASQVWPRVKELDKTFSGK